MHRARLVCLCCRDLLVFISVIHVLFAQTGDPYIRHHTHGLLMTQDLSKRSGWAISEIKIYFLYHLVSVVTRINNTQFHTLVHGVHLIETVSS